MDKTLFKKWDSCYERIPNFHKEFKKKIDKIFIDF